jgi:hypothetical protein
LKEDELAVYQKFKARYGWKRIGKAQCVVLFLTLLLVLVLVLIPLLILLLILSLAVILLLPLLPLLTVLWWSELELQAYMIEDWRYAPSKSRSKRTKLGLEERK